MQRKSRPAVSNASVHAILEGSPASKALSINFLIASFSEAILSRKRYSEILSAWASLKLMSFFTGYVVGRLIQTK
jgi:hypothetical protein